MRRLVVVVALACGCDRALGLHSAALADGAMPDAPRTCAAGAPDFHPDLHQIVTTPCTDVTLAPDAQVATCIGVTTMSGSVLAGDLGGALTPIASLGKAFTARFDPDLNGALVVAMGTSHWTRYTRDPQSGTWSVGTPVPAFDNNYILGWITAPSRGPDLHVIAVHNDASLDELVSSDGVAWTVAMTYTPASFGAGLVEKPTMTADGLHLVFVDNANPQHVRYAQRARIDEPFSGSITLDALAPYTYALAVGTTLAGYLAEDCNRFYFADYTLSSVFYVQQ